MIRADRQDVTPSGGDRDPETQTSGDLTRILARIESGDLSAGEELMEAAYEELRALAEGFMRSERDDHTLQPTALVNEAAMRLLNPRVLRQVRGRAYFFGAMATTMRRVLVDHARARRALRRGRDRKRLPLDTTLDFVEEVNKINLLDLEEALKQLEQRSKRQADVVVMRFFGGFSVREIAANLGIAVSTVEKDWRLARAWLRRQLA